jgi:uncharacterized membrane protein
MAMTRSRNVFFIAALFFFAGAMHFVIPRSYASIMPPWLPGAMMLVYVSGVMEMAGAVGVLIEPVRRFAGLGLIALLIAVFPANVQMLQNAMMNGASRIYVTLLLLRLPLQPLMIVWIYRATVRPRRAQVPRTNL